jgi:hypothetical protein
MMHSFLALKLVVRVAVTHHPMSRQKRQVAGARILRSNNYSADKKLLITIYN